MNMSKRRNEKSGAFPALQDGVSSTTGAMLTYKFRLRDTAASELCRQTRAVNHVWNFCNDVQKQALKWNKKWPTGYDLQKLTAGSGKELNLHAHTVQQVCQQYERSRRQHKKAWLKWRGKKSLGWVPFNNGHVTYRDGAFWFRGRGYPAWVSRELQDGQTFGAGSFNQDARGRWYINLPVEIAVTACVDPDAAVGIDLGHKTLATCSDGTVIQNPKHYRNSEEKLARLQRAGKRKQVRKLHQHIGNQRHDHLHKASAHIAGKYGTVIVGAAKLAASKSSHDASWSSLKNMLRYKSIRNGGAMIEVNEAYTTQACSRCGSIEGPRGLNDLRIREWTCGCGVTHDRDVNAARNILTLGLQSLVAGALS